MSYTQVDDLVAAGELWEDGATALGKSLETNTTLLEIQIPC